jgi:hypothetical protein
MKLQKNLAQASMRLMRTGVGWQRHFGTVVQARRSCSINAGSRRRIVTEPSKAIFAQYNVLRLSRGDAMGTIFRIAIAVPTQHSSKFGRDQPDW